MDEISNSRHVELSWAGRVRTGNRQSFDYLKDNEAVCRFKEALSEYLQGRFYLQGIFTRKEYLQGRFYLQGIFTRK